MSFTAHDVRHLAVCEWCGGVGDGRLMLGKYPHASHGDCFITAKGMSAFLELPSEQTDRMTLGDIGMDAMKALLDIKQAKRVRS